MAGALCARSTTAEEAVDSIAGEWDWAQFTAAMTSEFQRDFASSRKEVVVEARVWRGM